MSLLHHYYSIWDLEQGSKLHSFSIGGKVAVKITAVDYINPHDITFLLTGSGIHFCYAMKLYIVGLYYHFAKCLHQSDDGVVRIWRDYTDPSRKPQLVASWRAVHDMLPTNKSKS